MSHGWVAMLTCSSNLEPSITSPFLDRGTSTVVTQSICDNPALDHLWGTTESTGLPIRRARLGRGQWRLCVCWGSSGLRLASYPLWFFFSAGVCFNFCMGAKFGRSNTGGSGGWDFSWFNKRRWRFSPTLYSGVQRDVEKKGTAFSTDSSGRVFFSQHRRLRFWWCSGVVWKFHNLKVASRKKGCFLSGGSQEKSTHIFDVFPISVCVYCTYYGNCAS
ncbi:hypothetical protein QBC36DRAFT_125306 [Triangularia setosa]|uniref:Uncharacterized protein n=1 Tax=Triangularia setosa TaxID=2587417 RepID=A0AAN6W999_9PEZI|nr:hypothetical protein QBC36DRAFT_125306 [Podospora setosa]